MARLSQQAVEVALTVATPVGYPGTLVGLVAVEGGGMPELDLAGPAHLVKAMPVEMVLVAQHPHTEGVGVAVLELLG